MARIIAAAPSPEIKHVWGRSYWYGDVVRDTWWTEPRIIMVTGYGTGIILRDAEAPVGTPVGFIPTDSRIARAS